MMTAHFLTQVTLNKREEVLAHRGILSEKDLLYMIEGAPEPLSLKRAIRRRQGLAIIAEMKKGSPSEGVIREKFFPTQIAEQYVQAGADAISVLTDEDYFLGSLSHVIKIRPFVDRPILRKDFIVDPYQVLEARAFGADAVLLIAAALEEDELAGLYEKTYELGMEALVEVHNAEEMKMARKLGARIIGINNRDLATFEIDLKTTEELAPLADADTIIVAESGLHTAEDVMRMVDAGADAILVGTHFMRHENPGAALLQFRRKIEDATRQDLRRHPRR